MVRLYVRELSGRVDALSWMAATAGRPSPAILDSSAYHQRWGRFTYLAADPLLTAASRDGRTVEIAHSGRIGGGSESRGRDVLAGLEDLLARTSGRVGGPAPLAGGWIGYFGYELGYLIEPTARVGFFKDAGVGFPQMRLGFYDTMVVMDHLTGRAWLTTLQFPAGHWLADGLSAEQRLDRWEQMPRGSRRPEVGAPVQEECWGSNFSREAYQAMVERAIRYIAAGDIFQVNLSQRFRVARRRGPLELYVRLRRTNPAWFSGLLAWEESAVLSVSPELFLRVRGREVITRPIKGTRPRIGDEVLDRVRAKELLASAKDNAELAMIIDLERNDLGRVCEYGSIRVGDARKLEAHPTVFHLVGTVEGRLRPGVTIMDLLRATFPGGSITGAPKVRAMQIIDELEPSPRGVYTGAIGWIGVNGDADLNIAIRTAVCHQSEVSIQVGGGIVADSDPYDEYAETLAKARGMLAALGVDLAHAGPEAPSSRPRESAVGR